VPVSLGAMAMSPLLDIRAKMRPGVAWLTGVSIRSRIVLLSSVVETLGSREHVQDLEFKSGQELGSSAPVRRKGRRKTDRI
jgi:hypothetical protein